MLANGGNSPIRIVIIDDNELSCTLLSRFFSVEDDLDIVGTACSGYAGLGLVQLLQPDVVLTDYNLPDIDGHDLTAALCQETPHIPVVVMSAECETWVADRVQQAGARAFVLKDGDTDGIVNVIRQLVRVH